MAILGIPEEHQGAIFELGNLIPSQQDALVNAMGEASPSREVVSLVRQIAAKSGVSEYHAANAVGLINALYGVADFTGQAYEDVINDVIETIQAQDGGNLSKLTPVQIESVRGFLRRALVPNGTVGLSAKAQRIAVEHERVFLSSEMFTDVRTVFQVNAPDIKPAAALLTHMLKIDYRQDGRRKTLYLALDSNDLAQLRESIDRAGKKEERLTALLADTGVIVLELEREK